jgi:hypothetical protein
VFHTLQQWEEIAEEFLHLMVARKQRRRQEGAREKNQLTVPLKIAEIADFQDVTKKM